ncbi:MAG TPA: hypothetical protein VHG29_03030 [Novosphingobium sp.]|nr:hypothetical protein [Novosphingobium sp.]
MVVLAALVSRIEALVVASMLEAAGVLVHIGGAGHASVEINSVALGGHRLWVPASQHLAASEILLEVLDDEEWSFSFGLRKAVLRVVGVWVATYSAMILAAVTMGAFPVSALLLAPFGALAFPVNPQGRGDYYLHPSAGDDSLA